MNDGMDPRPVGLVTFDLWDCVFVDDSDEPKRKAAGRPTKREERRILVHQALSRQSPISRDKVDLAYDVTDAAFRKVWHDQCVTWTVRERLGVLLAGLGRELPEQDLSELVKRHEEMELEFRPDPVPGVHEAVAALKKIYRLAVISDAIFTPGRALRELLAGENLLQYFEAFAFSDEMGYSKPAAQVFESVAKAAGVEPRDIVHIGDRPHNDVNGAHRVGARAILLTAVKDRGADGCGADVVCSRYSDLPGALKRLEA